MPGIFKSFRSTVSPWDPRNWTSMFRLLVDNNTGAPIGIESLNANGPDGIWAPVDVTQAQILAPSAAMIADLNATYRLNVPPYTRYQSDGASLTAIGAQSQETIIPAGFNYILYSPLTIAAPQELIVIGQVRVETYPA